jgi:hypothetical protein
MVQGLGGGWGAMTGGALALSLAPVAGVVVAHHGERTGFRLGPRQAFGLKVSDEQFATSLRADRAPRERARLRIVVRLASGLCPCFASDPLSF